MEAQVNPTQSYFGIRHLFDAHAERWGVLKRDLFSQHTRRLIALPGLPPLAVVAKFLFMFLLTKDLLPSKKDGCQKDMKRSIFFLLRIIE